MRRLCWTLLLPLVSLALPVLGRPAGPAREVEPDEAGQEQQLNRELWEARKHRPYEEAEEHVRRARRHRKSARDAGVVLPTGWRLMAAGDQTPVGRLPYHAVSYGG